ncbi:MAG TPA: carboxymuconolactone decarboxylase family protein [Bauldia sp.]|nr:carboxymuconolactone decarboxylase family protein [Bauldia sp.]
MIAAATKPTGKRVLGLAAAAVLFAGVTVSSSPAVRAAATLAPAMSAEDVYKDIEKTWGSVPAFIKQLPKAMLAGAWQEEKDLELSDKTALSPKVKALISLAVAAQIPCSYCIWADTNTAKQMGATDEEIGEAVAMAALTRHWSTLFNGLQVDFAQFKKDFGG